MAIEHQEWLNQNSYRAFPLKETDTRQAVDSNGLSLPDIQIPNNLLVDFVLTVADTTASAQVYISRIAYIAQFLSLEFKDSAGNLITTLAVNIASHTPYTRYALIGQETYEDARGAIVLGDLSGFADQFPQGNFEFNLAASELEPCTVRPDLRGVRSLQGQTNEETTDRLYGHVRLIAGDNIRLTYVPADNAIRIDAIDATGFTANCQCTDQFQLPCITSINGIPVEDVQIVGDKCIQVTTSGNQIMLSDRCSQPCCGCVELEFLTKSFDLLEDQLSRLEGYADQMRDKLIQFITNVLVTL